MVLFNVTLYFPCNKMFLKSQFLDIFPEIKLTESKEWNRSLKLLLKF